LVLLRSAMPCVTGAPGHEPIWYSFYIVPFEFDPAKSAANMAKHGIDFIEAQALWDDPDRLEIPARSVDEPRAQVIGMIGRQAWSAFVTSRGERVRIISVRRARDEEKARYIGG